MRPWSIYVLEDPRDGRIRYVGVTHQRLATRLNGHLSRARRGFNSHSANWIRRLLADGLRPAIREVEKGFGEGWGSAESKWMAHYRALGCALTNLTSGGEGCPGHSVSLAAREKIRAARLGSKLSEEAKAKLRAANCGKKMSPDAIRRSVDRRRGRSHSPESISKMSKAKLGKKMPSPRPEVIARMAASARASYQRRLAAGLIPEVSSVTRAKISAAIRGKRRSEATKLRMSEAAKRAYTEGRRKCGRTLKTCPLCGVSGIAKARFVGCAT